MPAGEVIGQAVIRVGADFPPEARKKLENDTESAAKGAANKFLDVFKSAAFIGGMFKAIQSASDLNEEVSKTKVIFGNASADVEKFAKDAAKNMGLSEKAYLSASSNLKGLLDNLGLTNEASTEWSGKLVQLGSDLASFFNKDPEQAVYALGAALRGESEPIRQFNVNINEAAVKAEAFRLGLYSGKGQLDANAKAQATLNLIMQQTTAAQGDFARTADGAANSQRIQAATAENAAASMGQIFLPAYTKAVQILTAMMKVFGELPAPLQFVVVALVGLAALSGPIKGLGGVIKDVTTAIKDMGAGSATAGIALGALGLVIIGATAWYLDYAAKKAKVAQITKDFVQALEDEAAGQKGAVQAGIEKGLSDEKLIKQAAILGLSVSDLAKIVQGEQVPAYAAFQKVASEGGFTMARLVENSKILGISTDELAKKNNDLNYAFGTVNAALAPLNDGLENAHTQFDTTQKVARELAAATTETDRETRKLTKTFDDNVTSAKTKEQQDAELERLAKANEEATKRLTDTLEDESNQFTALAHSADLLSAAIDQVFGGTLSLEDASRDLAAGFDEVEKNLTKSNNSLDINTEKGRANRELVEKQVKSILDYGVALVGAGKSNDEASTAIEIQTQHLRDQLTAAGLTKDQIDDYLATLGLTPANVTTTLQLAGDTAAKESLDALLVQLGDIDKGAAAQIDALIEEGKFAEAEARIKELARARGIVLNLLPGQGLKLTFAAGTNPLIRFDPVTGGIPRTSRGGIFDRMQLRSISEGNKLEAVLPLTDDARLRELLADPRVAGPVSAAMASDLGTGQSAIATSSTSSNGGDVYFTGPINNINDLDAAFRLATFHYAGRYTG